MAYRPASKWRIGISKEVYGFLTDEYTEAELEARRAENSR